MPPTTTPFQSSTRRFRYTYNEPAHAGTGHVLEKGWTTTQVMIVGAKRAARLTGDRCFTYADLVEAVRKLMATNGLTYPGFTGKPDKYEDDAQRIVDGRFGDLHRSGIFEEVV